MVYVKIVIPILGQMQMEGLAVPLLVQTEKCCLKMENVRYVHYIKEKREMVSRVVQTCVLINKANMRISTKMVHVLIHV